MATQRKKEAAKKEAKLKAKGVIEKPTKKSKGFRLRKGTKIKGIVVSDSESKRKVHVSNGLSTLRPSGPNVLTGHHLAVV